MNESKPWYQSKGVLGGATASLAGFIKLTRNIDISDLITTLSNNWDAVVAFGGGVLAIIGRLKAAKPITGTAIAVAATKTAGIVLLFALALNGCSTTQQANAAAFANSPAGQVAIRTAVSGIIIGGMSVGSQYAGTGKISARQVVADELPVLYGSQQNLYSLMGTPKVNSSAAIIAAVNQGAGSTVSVAPTVANNVKAMINQGIDPNIAVQKAADALGATPTVGAAVSQGANPQAAVNNATKTIAAAPVIVPTPSPVPTPTP